RREPCRIGLESRMHIEAVAAAGAGSAVRLQRRMPVGDIDDAMQVAANEWLECRPQFGEGAGQRGADHALRVLDRSHRAAARRDDALRRAVDDHIADKAGKGNVVGADGKQHEVEWPLRARKCIPECSELARHAWRTAAAWWTFARPLAVE